MLTCRQLMRDYLHLYDSQRNRFIHSWSSHGANLEIIVTTWVVLYVATKNPFLYKVHEVHVANGFTMWVCPRTTYWMHFCFGMRHNFPKDNSPNSLIHQLWFLIKCLNRWSCFRMNQNQSQLQISEDCLQSAIQKPSSVTKDLKTSHSITTI